MDRRHLLRRWPWVIGTLASLAVLAGLIWAVWKLPPLLYGDVTKASPDARLQASSNFRTALVAGLAGLAAVGGLATAARTYWLTQQGQLSERYTKAIEQLGSDKLDVRLGGIYALERIAVDSKRDHPTVVEVLSAFAREHGGPGPAGLHIGAAEDANGGPTKTLRKPKPPTDVQAAVTVLGRLPQRYDPFSRSLRVSRGDLTGVHLEGGSLAGAHMEGAEMVGAHLEGANLRRAVLYAIHLDYAHLQGAILYGTELQGAKLVGAHLERAEMVGAHLERADMAGADLKRANLTRAELKGTDLRGAHLEGADLEDVEGLRQVQLNMAILDEKTKLSAKLRPPTSATANRPASEQP
jgi:hypothetical protein